MTSSINKNFKAAGLIAKLGNLALLGKRSKACFHLSGFWSMPCGAIEAGESPADAAAREFFEETGQKITSDLIFLTDFEMHDKSDFAVFFTNLEDLVFPSEKAKDAIEHDEWGFFKIRSNCLPEPMTQETKNALLLLR